MSAVSAFDDAQIVGVHEIDEGVVAQEGEELEAFDDKTILLNVRMNPEARYLAIAGS